MVLLHSFNVRYCGMYELGERINEMANKEFVHKGNTIYIGSMSFHDITTGKTGNEFIEAQLIQYRNEGKQILLVSDIEKPNILAQNTKRAHFHDGEWILQAVNGQIVSENAVFGIEKLPGSTTVYYTQSTVNEHKIHSGIIDSYAYAVVEPMDENIARVVISNIEDEQRI